MDKHTERMKGKLERKHIRFFDGDCDFLDERFPRAGHTVIVRNVVHAFVKRLKETENQIEARDVGEFTVTIE